MIETLMNPSCITYYNYFLRDIYEDGEQKYLIKPYVTIFALGNIGDKVTMDNHIYEIIDYAIEYKELDENFMVEYNGLLCADNV